MIFVATLFALTSLSVAQPIQESNTKNVIVVPPNCPPGQELVNGVCRDIWSLRKNINTADLGVIDFLASPRNVVTVPPNCPPGQELINGVCRDVWRLKATNPLPPNDQYSNMEESESERQTYSQVKLVDEINTSDQNDRGIINIPPQCPIGYKPDALGICRKILR